MPKMLLLLALRTLYTRDKKNLTTILAKEGAEGIKHDLNLRQVYRHSCVIGY